MQTNTYLAQDRNTCIFFLFGVSHINIGVDNSPVSELVANVAVLFIGLLPIAFDLKVNSLQRFYKSKRTQEI